MALTPSTAVIDRYSLLNNEGFSVIAKKCIYNSVGCVICNFVLTCAHVHSSDTCFTNAACVHYRTSDTCFGITSALAVTSLLFCKSSALSK